MTDAISAGYNSRKDYAAARRQELCEALSLASLPLSRCFEAGIPDQEASENLRLLTRRFIFIFRSIKPGLVLTPSYEGGHPDHDATAFAVHAACLLLRRKKLKAPIMIEYALYHSGPNGIRVSNFLPAENGEIKETLILNKEQESLKIRMIGCFHTQRKVLAAFPTSVECFRPAPAYDFSSPPHSGRLYYENFDWGMDGKRWRQLASGALKEFGITGKI
jgi:LmbE family N-acetylglucosaminyl deacetylase